MSLNTHEISIIKGMLERGDRQHDIAAYFGVNGGRIAEVKNGTRGHDIEAAPFGSLPPSGPYMAGRSALHAKNTLLSLRDMIDVAIAEIDVFERASSREDDVNA